MKLTVEQATGVYGALQNLDGRERAVGNKDNERIIMEPYKLGALRLTIAKNCTALKNALSPYEKARNDFIVEKSGGTGTIDPKDNKEAAAAVLEQTQKWLAEEIDVKIEKLSYADLKVEENNIPISVLADLAPIIKDE